ncbi:MAG: pyridoxamine 5'-phosphate oxidase [Balneolia bacterium]|nr:pyridoxamine 5'-phosphate oxidase [Balneolia bacterium]
MQTKEIAGLRKNYTLETLDRTDVDSNPVQQFKYWFEQAVKSEIPEPNAMVLATASSSGQPRARVVLLKGVDERGFLFYTNYGSNKGKELGENPKASLCFNWLELERQVRIDGRVEKLPASESDAYFNSRPFESRIGALASHQSAVVGDRQQLETTYEQLLKEYEGKDVPRPESWGGYLVIPELIEFWQGRPGRLHDRIEYKLEGQQWTIRRLSP